ncbi:MAG TPA: HAD family hydrolase [Gemmatimonadales bacterium]|jgi:D-glycero-D-manno-heptose 1,7-bisphosphate phosphatase|nr:HAD family hydrolase [Gemmatimonadales bacterium]
MSGRPAVFLDRDGTLIEDRHYLRDPAGVQLLPGVAAAVRKLNAAGRAVVVVTNQSGIARGLLSEADYAATADRLDELLAQEGAHLDARYHCPHHPELSGRCSCRKPGPLLYRQAAATLGLDLGRSWWLGDRVRDIAAAGALGGRGLLLLTGAGANESRRPEARLWPTARDLTAAIRVVLAERLQ